MDSCIDTFNISLLSNLANLIELVIFDKEKMRVLYDLYFAFSDSFAQIDLYRQILRVRPLELLDLVELLESLESLKRQDPLESKTRLKLLELLEEEISTKTQKKLDFLERLESPERREILHQLSKKSDEELLKELKPINDFLKEMKELEKKLPNCKIYY